MAALDWLTNWDDLVHGTVMFSVAVPFAVCLVILWKLPPGLWWLGIIGAVSGPFLWLFGFPRFPPATSEDVVFTGLVVSGLVASTLVIGGQAKVGGKIVAVSAGLLFGLLTWCVYPAWLAEEGGLVRKLSVVTGVSATMVIFVAIAEIASCKPTEESNRFRLPLAAWVPPLIGLAVLLQLGGAARLGQAAGALATALATACLVIIVRNQRVAPIGIPALCGTMFALLGWSGWLFADVRYGLALVLCLGPVAAVLGHFIPLPRRNEERFVQLWCGLFSAVITGAVVALAVSDYLAEMKEFEGY
ncbi:MAG: hypothetical protein KDN22_03150 [Verrucomicrobiae bacterium]|nr:hypothetical protein [Verrucomicrobiae bacterium]